MKATYDPKADAVYIQLSDKKSTKTVEMSESLSMDYNGKKSVGIEILDASNNLGEEEIKKVIATISKQSNSMHLVI